MTSNLKIKLLLLFIIFTSLSSWAVKMHSGIKKIKQPDNTIISIIGYGNHDFNFLTTTDGVLLYQEGITYYVAKVNYDGTLSSTGIIAHEKELRNENEKRAILEQNESKFYSNIQNHIIKNRMCNEKMLEDATLLPHRGSPRIPVILVEFSDSTFTINDPKNVFNKYLNATELFDETVDADMGLNYGSVRRYFSDMSFGQFSPIFDIYGPVRLQKPLKYYGDGNSTYENMNDLFTDACRILDTEIDFSKYDSNNDGNVDLVYIIYAGYSQSIVGNSTECIYPKSGLLSSDSTFDGKRILRYGVCNELNGTPQDQAEYGLLINGIGLFCHEFSHCMGLPDMYPMPGSIAERCINQNLDYWDLMDAGEYTMEGYRPTEYTAWERERFGWIKIDTLNTPQKITLTPLSSGGKAYKILNDNDETGNEYYIIENVQNKDWNKYLYGHGMLVYHVDYDDYMFSLGGCKVNSTVGHPRMSLIAADGMFVPEYFVYTTITDSGTEQEQTINRPLIEKYLGQFITSTIYTDEAAGDPYPGIVNSTSLTDTSSPVAKVYYGETLGKPITNILEDTTEGTVCFMFMDSTETDGIKDNNIDTSNFKIYSLDGRFAGTDINELKNGIYIINRNKIFIK